jgi:hypothetical protein
MSTKRTEYKININGFLNIGTEEHCREFVDILLRNGLEPERYGDSERTKYIFTQDDFVRYRVDIQNKKGFGNPFIKGDSCMISLNWGGGKPYVLWLIVSEKNISDTDNLLKLAEDLFTFYGSCYGYVTLSEESNKLYSPGYSIFNCLSGIAWANLFGKPYVEMWGEDKIIKAPTWKTKKLLNESYALIISDSPRNKELNYLREKELKNYLTIQVAQKRLFTRMYV